MHEVSLKQNLLISTCWKAIQKLKITIEVTNDTLCQQIASFSRTVTCDVRTD